MKAGIDPARMAILRATYNAALVQAVGEYPDDYAYDQREAVTVAARIMTVVERDGPGAVNLDGRAWRATAQALGIRCSYPAFRDWLKGA